MKKAMKTVLVMPKAEHKEEYPVATFMEPLGIAYIASCVRDISNVKIIHCDVEKNFEKKIVNQLNTNEDIIIGFSTNTYNYPETLRLAKKAKSYNPDVHINFGGYHATPLAEVILKNRDFVDSIVREDGEVPFRELVIALSNEGDLSKVPSLTYRNDGKIKSNPIAPLPSLDSLPYPARDLLPMEKYFENLRKSSLSNAFGATSIVSLMINRGCPRSCDYCGIFNKRFRSRTVSNILNELKQIIEIYDPDMLYIVGDNLNLDEKLLQTVSKTIVDNNIKIKWTGVTLNANSVNKCIEEMSNSGCKWVYYGFESGSQKMLDAMNKKYTVETYKKAIQLTKKYDIKIIASFILGTIGETKETLEETIKFARDNTFDRIQASLLAPLPGSSIYRMLCDRHPELHNADSVPIEDMQKLYLQEFCNLDYEALEEVRIELRETANTASTLY